MHLFREKSGKKKRWKMQTKRDHESDGSWCYREKKIKQIKPSLIKALY